MSFSVKGEERGLRIRGHAARAVLPAPQPAQPAHFQRMIADLLRFNRELRRLLGHEETGESARRGRARPSACRPSSR